MANFSDSPHFSTHDDYYTPKSAWASINHLIPKDKVIVEAFMLNSNQSKSAEYLEELGNTVYYDKRYDFIEGTRLNEKIPIATKYPKMDMIVSNPPYSKKLKQAALRKLHEVDKPFIIILNSNILYTNYLRDIFGEDMKHIQVINPRGKINFDKYENDTYVPT